MEQEAALPRNDGNVRKIQRLQEALELARVKIEQSFQKQKKYYDLRRRSWTPSIGDQVLKNNGIKVLQLAIDVFIYICIVNIFKN